MGWPSWNGFVAVWRAAWHEEAIQAATSMPKGKAVEFLPAVLEIQHAPPSPIGRAILWTIMILFVTAVAWACFSRVDMISVAQGKVIVSGYSKVIQPLESGVVTAIHVHDGQVVKQGEGLIELDMTVSGAERARLANEYGAAQLERQRLRSLLKGHRTFEAPVESPPELVVIQRRMLKDQLDEYHAKLDAARHVVEQRDAAVDIARANVGRLEATVPIENERAAAYQKLFADQFVSKMDYLQFEQQRIERVQELAGQKQRLVQEQAALAEAANNYAALVSDFQQTRQAELSDVETRAASLQQEIIKANQRSQFQRLTSPTDGIVQQLSVHTVGGVVMPAQQLLVVVPMESPMEVEAWLENRDIGFVKEGQAVQIKVETFPFTLYGVIDGKVLTVSSDAVQIDKVGLMYVAHVSMARSTMEVEGQLIRLTPGMAVTAEITTGTRRVIEYVLSPLLKAVHESVRER